MYDDSMYRLIPAGPPGPQGPPCWPHSMHAPHSMPPPACYGMTDEELQREYAVVLDALSAGAPVPNLCAGCPVAVGGHVAPVQHLVHHAPQIATESPLEQSCSGSDFQHFVTGSNPPHFYSNWGRQTSCCPQVASGGLHYPASNSILETCVDDIEILDPNSEFAVLESCEEYLEEMVSSWAGISGVPGLGYSIPPRGLEDLEAVLTSVNPKINDNAATESEKSEWSAKSAQHLASLKFDLPRVQPHHGPEFRTRTASTTHMGPRGHASVNSTVAKNGGYNGVSAFGHLMSDPQYFERHNPNTSAKKPLRATVSSKLRSKLSLPAAFETGSNHGKGPQSLPSHFIPRAPIPTPEALAAVSKKRASQQAQGQQKGVSVLQSPPAEDFSANNEAILQSRQDQIYQSPKERDGDYSYAYDCSISPAVVIKWNEEAEEDLIEDFGDSDEDLSDQELPVKTRNKGLKKDENIYEEIQDVSASRQGSSGGSSVNNSDSGIGGAVSKSSFTNGTLDISRPRKKATIIKKYEENSPKRRTNRRQQHLQTVPLSSLDALISQTSPDLTPHQKLNLRKSLVDELFEELIQRHHKRVLDELRLDVEEFIAPSPDSLDRHSQGTPKSTRSSNSAKLIRCESMDFKQGSTNQNKTRTHQVGSDPEKKSGSSKFWQSARKCSEVIQKKLKKSSNGSASQSSVTELDAKVPSSNPGIIPTVTSQVTRRGHRPLSAIVTRGSSENHPKMNDNNVIQDTLEDDSDTEQEAAVRRLLRSQIIKSFWEQHDATSNKSDYEDTEVNDHKNMTNLKSTTSLNSNLTESNSTHPKKEDGSFR